MISWACLKQTALITCFDWLIWLKIAIQNQFHKVWFQNRRAKLRKIKRSQTIARTDLANKNKKNCQITTKSLQPDSKMEENKRHLHRNVNKNESDENSLPNASIKTDQPNSTDISLSQLIHASNGFNRQMMSSVNFENEVLMRWRYHLMRLMLMHHSTNPFHQTFTSVRSSGWR